MVLATLGAYGAYFVNGTPSYLINELQGDERDVRGLAYLHSAVEFKELLAA